MFPIRGAECEIRENKSDSDYLEGEHGVRDDGANDNDNVPNTSAIIQHTEDLPSFVRTLDIEAMHAPKFPQYANIASNYAADGELYVGMKFNDRKVVVRAIKSYGISKSMDYYVCESESRTFYLSANITAWGAVSLLGLVSEKRWTYGKSESIMAHKLVLQ